MKGAKKEKKKSVAQYPSEHRQWRYTKLEFKNVMVPSEK